jgi:hypothetical protein
VKEIFPSCHDDMYRGTMALLGEQADEAQFIHPSQHDGLLRPVRKNIRVFTLIFVRD